MHVALRRAWGMRQGATQRRRLTGAQAGGVLRAPRGHGRRSCLKIVGLDGLGSCENKGPFTKTRPALLYNSLHTRFCGCHVNVAAAASLVLVHMDSAHTGENP